MHRRLVALMSMDYWSGYENIPRDLETVDLHGHSHKSTPSTAFRRGCSEIGYQTVPDGPVALDN